MDMITILGFVAGIGGILLGQALEGGEFGALVQFTAAFIVVGGTVGATLVSSTREDLRTALLLLRTAFRDSGGERAARVAGEIVDAARHARKESMLTLEKRVQGFSDPFMQHVFRFMIDGIDPSSLRDLFEAEIDLEEEKLLAGAKVFTDAGGFSPTIGIIGAVLGLIHVMNNITDTSKLGSGIAVAFVATVYGVGLANLVLLPLGNKIKRKVRRETEIKNMILEGAASIAAGLSPHLVHEKIRVYADLGPDEGRPRGPAAPPANPVAPAAPAGSEKATA
jgi:chemotaxis protein MotA